MQNGGEAIQPDEILYRRILPSYYQPALSPKPSLEAFRPTKHDADGLSFFRESRVTLAQASQHPRKPEVRHPVAKLRAGDLTDLGVELRIDEPPPGHIITPNVCFANRDIAPAINWIMKMANELCEVVEAPAAPGPEHRPEPPAAP